jgi:hypothetical protein
MRQFNVSGYLAVFQLRQPESVRHKHLLIDSKRKGVYFLGMRSPGRPRKPIADRSVALGVCAPQHVLNRCKRLAKRLGLSKHEFVEALILFVDADLSTEELAALLREHIRWRKGGVGRLLSGESAGMRNFKPVNNG